MKESYSIGKKEGQGNYYLHAQEDDAEQPPCSATADNSTDGSVI